MSVPGPTSHPLGSPYRMRVVAVSRGIPSWHNVNGHQTQTSIVRTPSNEPLSLAPSGISGNRSAARDAEVYAFFAHHYDYWTSRLGLDRSAWEWCRWGENLILQTESHLDESNFYLGDRLEIRTGSKPVVLEVCGGRIPCSRLAWRCGQKSSWLKEVAQSGYFGFYL